MFELLSVISLVCIADFEVCKTVDQPKNAAGNCNLRLRTDLVDKSVLPHTVIQLTTVIRK